MAAVTGFLVYIVTVFLGGFTMMHAQKTDENFKMISFNEEYIEFTWIAEENCSTRNLFSARNLTFSYLFYAWKKCINYFLKEDCNIGCRFKNEKPGQMSVSIHDSGVDPERGIFKETLMTYNYEKPNLPENVTIRWEKNTVIVTCNIPKQKSCFKYEIHYKSKFDENWQPRETECCTITDSGFDLEKCYSFRVRLKRSTDCSSHPHPGEWSPITFWKNGTPKDSCPSDESTNVILSRNVILIMSLVGSLAIFILLYCICTMKQLHKQIMPLIPDPKYSFSDLFDNYNGDFQAWLDESDNVAKLTYIKYSETECIIDEEMKDDDGKEEEKEGGNQ